MRAATTPRSSVVLVAALAGLAGFLGAAPRRAHATGIHVSFTPAALTVQPGDTFTVTVEVAPADARFNAFDLVLDYDPLRLALVPTTPLSAQRGALMTNACANTFHSFTPEDGHLSASLSLLCNDVDVTGPGVIYTVHLRALDGAGVTTVTCSAGTRFYDAGIFVDPLESQSMAVMVGVTAVGYERMDGLSWAGAPAPNPWRGGPVDVPLLLGRDMRVRVSVVDAAGRTVFRLPPRSLGAGIATVVWTPPALPAGVYNLRIEPEAGKAASRRWVVAR